MNKLKKEKDQGIYLLRHFLYYFQNDKMVNFHYSQVLYDHITILCENED